MKRSTNVKRHSRKGTKGVRQHTREVSSPEAHRVPHDSLVEEEEETNEEEDSEEFELS